MPIRDADATTLFLQSLARTILWINDASHPDLSDQFLGQLENDLQKTAQSVVPFSLDVSVQANSILEELHEHLQHEQN